MIKTILIIVFILLFLGALKDWLRIALNHPIITGIIIIYLLNQLVMPYLKTTLVGWKGMLFIVTVILTILFSIAGKDSDNKED